MYDLGKSDEFQNRQHQKKIYMQSWKSQMEKGNPRSINTKGKTIGK